MVKRIRAAPFDLQHVLVRSSPAQSARTLEKRWGRQDAIDAVYGALVEEPWAYEDVPARAVDTLFLLGGESLLLDEFLERAKEPLPEDLEGMSEDEQRDWWIMNLLTLAFGLKGSPDAVERMLTFLDAFDDASRPQGAIAVIDALVGCGERGLRDERTWRWLEQLRSDDVVFWSSLCGSYGDPRAIPLLHALLDDINVKDAESDDDELRRYTTRVIIDGVDSLELLGAVRPTDQALLDAIVPPNDR